MGRGINDLEHARAAKTQQYGNPQLVHEQHTQARLRFVVERVFRRRNSALFERSQRPSQWVSEETSPARVMGRMQNPQPLPRHVRVNLRRGNICVPKEHLHRAQVSPMVQQMGGECVAQRVR
jgi:hypothetical protein